MCSSNVEIWSGMYSANISIYRMSFLNDDFIDQEIKKQSKPAWPFVKK